MSWIWSILDECLLGFEKSLLRRAENNHQSSIFGQKMAQKRTVSQQINPQMAGVR